MFKILFALAGLLLGVVLSYIAPEELKAGKTYFILLKRIIFLLMVLLAGYYLWIDGKIIYVAGELLFAAPLFWWELRRKNKILEIGVYIFSIGAYLLISNNNYGLILTVLVFLYGLPAGTLLRKIP